MVLGTGQLSDAMDYSEVGGPNANRGGAPMQKKGSGLNGPKDVK